MRRPSNRASRQGRAAIRGGGQQRADSGAGLASQLALSREPREPFEPTALARWSRKLGGDAKSALRRVSRRLDLGADISTAPLRRFMTGGRARTALDVQPTPWLRLTETQISRPLADFMNEGAPARIMAFLRALPCKGIDLPDAFEFGEAKAEVPVKGGRIDLLVKGMTGSVTYGAAIEVKIDHMLHNPLGAYAELAKYEGFTVEGRDKGWPTGTLAILARSANKATRKRLSYNRGWRFVHWSGFLRRFEREMANAPDDDDFRAFRRLVWDRFI